MIDDKPTPKLSQRFAENRVVEMLIYYLAAALFPNIFLFNLYNRNRLEMWAPFEHVLLMGLIISIISIIVFIIFRLLVRNHEGALLALMATWLSFWLFNTTHSFMSSFFFVRVRYLLLVQMGIVLIIIIILRVKKFPLHKGRVIFNTLSLVICLLFLFNAASSLGNSGNVVDDDMELNFHIRRDFHVEPNLPSPDIFWIMPDGMINFTDFELYFDSSQDEFREFLKERGFLINEGAQYHGFRTAIGIPGLMSPDYYDSFLGEILKQIEDIPCTVERLEIYREFLDLHNISLPIDVAPYWELLHGFMQADYTAVSVATYGDVYQVHDRFYRLFLAPDADMMKIVEAYPLTLGGGGGMRLFGIRSDLLDLLVLATPVSYFLPRNNADWISIPEYEEKVNELTANTRNLFHERQIYRRFIDLGEIAGPKIVFTSLYFTHSNMWRWQDVEWREDSGEAIESSVRPYLYPLAHEHAAQVIMTLINMILDRNPNAVIVIQADHGMNAASTHNVLREKGFSDEDILRLTHSVMSAVRIPSQFGSIEEPIAPLNITRELVNRFVGENYELLSE